MMMLAKLLFQTNKPLDSSIIDNQVVYSDDDDDDEDEDVVHRTFREVSSSRLWSASSNTISSHSADNIDAHSGIDNVEINIPSSHLDYYDEDFDYDDNGEEEEDGGGGETRHDHGSSSIPTSQQNYCRRRKSMALLSFLLLLSPIVIHLLVRTSKTAKRNLRYEQFKARIVQLLLLSSSGSIRLVEETATTTTFADTNSPQHRALIYLVDGDSSNLDPNDPTISTRIMQRYALAVFYYSTHGSNWSSRKYWLTGLHECGWMFVICSDITSDYDDGEEVLSHDELGVAKAEEDDDYSNYAFREPGLNLFEGKVVTGLSLYRQELHGTIPTEIVLLEHLQVLDLGNNNLQGSMPVGIGNLRRLKKLYLQNNLLEGSIDEVEHLSALTRLIVENNRFAGTIPSDMGELISLEEVRMGLNQFYGNIPESLLSSTALRRLEIYGNQLSGELIIPQSSSLEYLHLYDNNLSGQLPPSTLCHLSKSLIDLRLNNNSFVGTIPDLNCAMERLELLTLGQNMFTGPIHDTLGESTPRLREIHLHENNLRSTIPHTLFLPENLTSVLLGNNELTGSLTADIVNGAHNLDHLYVNSNKMSGNLADFARATDLSRIRKLRLEDNEFSGTIPKLTMLESMELLYLHNNSLTGTLDHLRSGVNLKKLKVSNNQLEGDVTSVLENMKHLEVLSLNGNNLDGSREEILRCLPNLIVLDDEFVVPGK